MRIDAHQHFWRYEPAQYPWIRGGWPLRRDFLPEHLRPLLQNTQMDGCVAVQARQSIEETRWLLQLASENDFVKGVVGWIDLRRGDVRRQLAGFSGNPRFVGVRHVAQDEPDDEFLVRSDFMRGIACLQEFDLAYDLLVYPRQLLAAIRLARRFPRQRFVLDHIAKPRIAAGVLAPWSEHIRTLAQLPNVHCKISGMVTEADWSAWKREDFAPFLDTVLDAFSPSRLMYGSDWPVCLLAGSYRRVFDLAADYCSRLSRSEQDWIFGGSAAACYRLR
jgi:L-fuconolactonase